MHLDIFRTFEVQLGQLPSRVSVLEPNAEGAEAERHPYSDDENMMLYEWTNIYFSATLRACIYVSSLSLAFTTNVASFNASSYLSNL